MLLHEFDPNPVAVINPSDTHGPVAGCPKAAVSCFERSTFCRMVERLGGVEITRLKKANWDTPVYRTVYKGTEIALFEAYVGAVPGERGVPVFPRVGLPGRRGLGGLGPQPERKHHRKGQGRAAGIGTGGADRLRREADGLSMA